MKSAFLSLAIFAIALPAAGAPPLKPSDIEAIKSVITPPETELDWLKIPWRVNLTEAVKEASQASKPILLWEMDGHPLGCT